MLILPQNAVAPTTITLRFLSPVFGPDLTQCTAVASTMLRRDGTNTTLTFTIVSATSRELVAQYAIQPGDLTTTGAYYLSPALTVPGGKVPSESVPLFVGGPYNSTPALEQDAWIMAAVPVPSLGPVKQTWVNVSSSIVASPFGPHMALDLRSTPLSVTLWNAVDGELATFSDVYNAAASHTFTLNGAGLQLVPIGDGTYSTTATRTTAGFQLRLRFNAATNFWLPW